MLPESFNSNHVKFESLTFNGIQVPMGTTSFKSEYPTTVSLLTCSNKYGYFVAGTTDGFLFGETTRLRQLLRESKIEPTLRQLDCIVDKHLPLPVRQFHLSTDELRIIVCMTQGNVMIFDVKDIVDKKNNVTPSGSFKMDNEIIEFKPCPTIFTTTDTTSNNPSSHQNKIIMSDITNKNNQNDRDSKGYSELAIILVKNNNKNHHDYGCFVINWHTGFIKAKITYDSATAIAWSPKGDEIVCGFTNGSVKCYSVFGLQTYEISPPLSKYHQQQQQQQQQKQEEEKENDNKEKKEKKERSASHHVQEIIWIHPNTFFAIYTNEQGNNAYIIQKPSSPEQSIKYLLLDDITPLEKDHLLLVDYFHQKFYTHVIHDFGPDIKYAIIIASTISPHLRVVGHYQPQDINNECWATWTCPSYENHFQHSNNNNNARTQKNLRTFVSKYNTKTFTTTSSTEPIYPVGVTIDYTATPTLFGKSFDSITPILYYITNEGMINGYIINRGDKPFFSMYDGMIRVLSSLKNIPLPTKKATTVMEQQSSLNTNQQSIESDHPFIDAVKYYEQQEKVSLWKQPRPIPTFRSLGIKSNVPIPNSYMITKPTFGETSMSGFRFGTTPRFGDRGPTRLGVPISDETTMTHRIMDNNNNNNDDHNDLKPGLIDNNKTRKEFLFQDFFQQEESSLMNSLKTNNGSSSSSRLSFISGHSIHPTNEHTNNKKEQELNFLMNSVTDETFLCDSNSIEFEKMEEKKSIMNHHHNNSTFNGITTTTIDSQEKPIKNESSSIVENNTDNNTKTIISSDKNEKIKKNEQSQVTNDNNNNNTTTTTLSENEQKMKITKEDEDNIISNLDIQQHNEPMKLNTNNDVDFRDRALELLKEAGETYYLLLKEIESRLPVEEQQQQQQVLSSSSNSVKSSEKENNYPVKSSQPQQQQHQQQQEEEEERFINIKDIPGWLLTLRDSINNLKEDVLEKEQELRQLKYNLSQMEGIYIKAMNETKVKTVIVQQEENDEKKKSQLLYEQVANHLNRQVFLDKVMNNTIELQQQKQRQ
ncbi:hypothetical protein INT45_006711 [Circinella minor]|uniref:Nucleoporin Nup159/Nup146 N-terminal domain-containing protein n=1 Tax=Circinella minor TaxID=1195481 RepID=A0A8H7S3H3_9FUNG|nr:hypothetical protein INT45_006711 [Circinella minor]